MTKIKALPQELLFAVLNCIDSVAHLAQCRLVSKAWHEPATRAMLGKKITIKSDKDAFKLYRHLFRDSSKLPLLKHLHFELTENNLPFIIEELLHLTFTPYIQRLTGSVKANQFFTTLFEIADQSLSGFDQLEDLPTYTGTSRTITDQRQVKFGGIVRTFAVTVLKSGSTDGDTVVWSNYLHTFRNLTAFALEGFPTGIGGIDKKTMTRMTTEEVTSWATSNVSKETTLETLNIKALCRPELIEYLVFKYPNVANITIKGELWYPNEDVAVAQDNLTRVLVAVKRIRQKKLVLILPPTITFKDIKKVLSDSDIIALAVKQIDGQYQLEMKIN
ncbi:hypothetical protein MBANPS3_012212 [Mucor bainieri]